MKVKILKKNQNFRGKCHQWYQYQVQSLAARISVKTGPIQVQPSLEYLRKTFNASQQQKIIHMRTGRTWIQ